MTINYTYDPVADAMSITLKKGRVERTEEVAPGVLIDFDKKGTPLYIEILDARKRFTLRVSKRISGTVPMVSFERLTKGVVGVK